MFQWLSRSTPSRHLPRLLRRDRPVEPLIADLARGIRSFLRRADLSESALVLDGPGVALSTPLVALALLGMDRVSAFREVYCLSGSTFQYLCLLAQQQGGLRLTRSNAGQFYSNNQRVHRVGPPALARLVSCALRRGHSPPFDENMCRGVLENFVSAEFCQRRVSTLPENLRIWTHCDTDGQVETIHASHPRLRDMTVYEAAYAAVAVPAVYRPARFQGRAYSDAFWAPAHGRHLRQVYQSNRSVLSIHMHKNGVRRNVHYVKAHHDPSGRVRVGLDFVYFMLGLPNPEFDAGVRAALFEIDPVVV